MDEFKAAAKEEARAERDEGGNPVGSVLVYGGEIIGRGRDRRVRIRARSPRMIH
jgi:cytosine deaminase